MIHTHEAKKGKMLKVSLVNSREIEKPEILPKVTCNLEKLDLHQQMMLDLGHCQPCAERCGRHF